MHIYLEQLKKYYLYCLLFTSIKPTKFHISKHYADSANVKEEKNLGFHRVDFSGPRFLYMKKL